VKLVPLRRFSERVCQHVVRWTVFDGDFSGRNTVFDKKVSDVDVLGSFDTGLFTVGFQ
jgi:hypothetical protein